VWPFPSTLDTLLEQSSKDYANAEFSSAEGSRTFGAFVLITPLKQSSKDYANAKFCSAQGSRTFGAFVFDFCCAYFKMVNAFF